MSLHSGLTRLTKVLENAVSQTRGGRLQNRKLTVFAVLSLATLRCVGIVGDGGGGSDGGLKPDAGVTTRDSGREADDAGLELRDAGNAPSDAGSDPNDSGTDTDAGTEVTDSGTAPDAGVSPVDAGAVGSFTSDAGAPDGGILNAYYAYPAWKLWALDPAAVHYSGFNLGDSTLHQADFMATLEADRLFPDPTVNTYPAPFLALVASATQPAIAGFWDDAYATRDGAHTVLENGWGDGSGNGINLTGQYVRVPFGQCSSIDTKRLGVNFTSESFSYSGHHLIGSTYAVGDTERNFSFANTVRGTPAYLSYAETIADRGIDSYDALYSHSFQSVGRSNSETGALFKMLVAGGYLPRATKDLLKRHGAYAMVLINVFRQTLPYTEADGQTLPLASEMLQRPAYFSNGSNTSQEFVPRNQSYHQYNESLHLSRMIEMTKAMTVAPPMAIIRVVGLTVTKGGTTLVDNATTDVRLHGVNKTMARIWGNAGETLSVLIDVGGSYDLQGLPLSASWQTVYPQQHNISIVHQAGPLWRLTVTHDPMLPKGRLPVALFVNNGQRNSPPAFVNFYYPEPGQTDTPNYVSAANPISTDEVQKNLRPTFATSLATDWVNLKPGATTAFDLSCTDSEGFAVKYYRWLGEVGALGGSHFTYTAPSKDPGLVHLVHLICSDGTGGTSSTLVRLVVTPSDGALPSGWLSTVYGEPEASGQASEKDGVFEVVGNGPDLYNTDHGRIVFQTMSGDIDFSAKVLDLSVDGSTNNSYAKGGVMLRESLASGARSAFAFVQGNSASATPLSVGVQIRNAADWFHAGQARPGPAGPAYVKVMRRGSLLAGFQSADGAVWEQLWSTDVPGPSPTMVAGLAVLSADQSRGDEIKYARGSFEVLAGPQVSIPLATLQGTAAYNSYNFTTKATITLVAADVTHSIRYTLDGSTPGPGSPLYSAPFDITTAGPTVLNAKAFDGATPSQTLQVNLTVTP